MPIPRPGDITVPFKGGPVGMYYTFPQDDAVDMADDWLETCDGILFVLAHVDRWCFVLSSSQKLGWVYEHDLGPGQVTCSVFYVPGMKMSPVDDEVGEYDR